MQPAGFIAFDTSDASAIWGVGITAHAAIDDALRGAETAGVTLSDLWTLPASEMLISNVQRGGGTVSWRPRDGMAVAVSELRT